MPLLKTYTTERDKLLNFAQTEECVRCVCVCVWCVCDGV